jgi:HAD superfamily hydrolase (TIGR01509 family)
MKSEATKPAAILFDLDGTFVDTEELHRRAFNQTFMEFSLGWEWTPEMYEDLLLISGGEDRLYFHLDTLAMNRDKREQLRVLVPSIHRAKTALFAQLAEDARRLARPGIKRLIHEAKQEGCKVGVVATSVAPNVQSIVEGALGNESRGVIDAVATSAHVPRRKPAPDLYTTLLSMLGMPADRCLAIEDSANGVAAAKAAGLFTIAVPGRWTRSQDFSRADLVLSSLGDPNHPLSESETFMLRTPFLRFSDLGRLMDAQTEPVRSSN